MNVIDGGKMTSDSQGRLWISGQSGLYWFDGYSSHAPNNQRGDQAAQKFFARKFIYDDMGGLWINSIQDTLGYFDVNRNVELSLDRDDLKVWEITKISAGEMLLATNLGFYVAKIRAGSIDLQKAGFLKHRIDVKLLLKKGSAIYYATETEVYKGDLSPQAVEENMGYQGSVGKSMHVLEDGEIWLSGQNSLSKIERGEVVKTIPNIEVSEMLLASDGNLWVAVSGLGIWVVDANSGTVLRKFERQGDVAYSLESDRISGMYEDENSIIWINRFNRTLVRINPGYQAYSNISVNPWKLEASMLDNSSYDVVEHSSGNLWLGHSSGGISILDRNGMVVAKMPPLNSTTGVINPELSVERKTLPADSITKIVEDQHSDMWVAIRKAGIYRVNSETLQYKKEFSSDETETIFCMVFDNSGNLFVTSINGVFYLNQNTNKLEAVFEHDVSGMNLRTNYCFSDEQGNTWFAGRDFIGLIPTGEKTIKSMLLADDIKTPNYSGRVYNAIKGWGNSIFSSVGGGLVELKYDAELKAIQYEASELSGRFPGTFFELENGKLMSAHRVYNYETDKMEPQGRGVGINGVRGYSFAGEMLADGSIIYGSPDGLLMLRPAYLEPWTLDVSVVATEMEIDAEVSQGDKHNVELPAGTSTLTVEVSALDYTVPKDNRYAYRMKGY